MAETEIKRVIKIESGQSANTLNNLSARIKELKSSMGDLDIASEEYREVSEDINRLENTKRNAIRGVTAAVDGSYNAYSKELSVLQKHRKTLKEGTDEYKEMTKRVGELQDKLKEMDAEVGTHTRNVGNYSSAFSGLQNSVNQVTRELPVLTMGADRFFLAISNNLPILYDNIRAYRAMATEGKTNVGVLGALTKALFSWNTAITVGITLLTQYGGKIVDWVKGLFSAEDAIDSNAEAMAKWNKATEEEMGEVAKDIYALKKLSEEWKALGDNLTEKERFIRNNVEAFESLGFAVRSVVDAEDLLHANTPKYINALKMRARAAAAQQVAEEYYAKAFRKSEEALPARQKLSQYYTWIAETQGDPSLSESSKSGIITDYHEKIRKLGEEISAVEAAAKAIEQMGDSYFEIAESLRDSADKVIGDLNVEAPYEPPRTKAKVKYNNRITTIGAYRDTRMGIPELGSNAIDEAASIEANEARIKAYEQMASASAEERIAIEERLNDELAMIEEIRLTEHEILLNEMLRDEELTADERIAIEQQLSEVKVEQMEAQIKAEEERAAKAKEIKDKELEEEKKRKEQMIAISTSMATATSNILKNSAELLQEDSKERKALNAAAIVMDTYAAAMAGWKSAQSLMYPFNLVVGGTNVAASIAMGAAQLKNLYKVAEDGSNAMGSLSAPSVASSMPASYTRSLQGDNELTELNKETRVYVVESDITNAQKSARVRVESASF